jgi:DNA replication protein DnaC
VDYGAARGLDKSHVASLAGCEWVRQKLNLVIVGATGVGKTWLASAFGTQACRLGMPVVFYRASDLYGEIAVAMHDGSLPKLKAELIKPSLLILDDFGLGDISSSAAQILLDVVDRRMRSGSLLITSQYPTEQWHGLFPDPTIADAILDRVVHQSHRLTLKGDSMRKLKAKHTMQK